MGQEPRFIMPEGLDELRALLEADWPARRAALHGPLMLEGEDEGDGEGEGEGSGDAGEGDGEGEGDGGDKKMFDAAYVRKLRAEAAKHRKEAQEAKTRAQQYEDKDKTDAQRLQERATDAEERAAKAERDLARTRVALRKNLTEDQAKRLIGDTEEELEADADDLIASFPQTEPIERQEPRGRPRERLRPGAAPSAEPEETDPKKLADSIPRMY